MEYLTSQIDAGTKYKNPGHLEMQVHFKAKWDTWKFWSFTWGLKRILASEKETITDPPNNDLALHFLTELLHWYVICIKSKDDVSLLNINDFINSFWNIK